MRGRLYRQFMGMNDLVFDIGANAGNRTKVFAQLSKQVIAVEPQPSCVKSLQAQFSANPKIRVVPKALGAREGSAEIMISNATVISSLSPAWVQAVRESGRFSQFTWAGKGTVEVTTLDSLIEEFGSPGFIKIDVEGYEFEVLSGLSRPVRALSFEFVPEYLAAAFQCIERLCSLGNTEFNYSLGESMKLALRSWVPRDQITSALLKYTGDNHVFGDVYARSTTRDLSSHSMKQRALTK
ncbi:MAG: FkbM family methyltransferase [Acidobacteriia bacterium]|nr:FkbM family methyltransferase [Terriglobia bacterium]